MSKYIYGFIVLLLIGSVCQARIVAHWKMDETVGPVLYDSVGVYDATLNGNTPLATLGQPPEPNALFGTSVEFDGHVVGDPYAGEIASVPYDEALNGETFSVSFWCKPSGILPENGFDGIVENRSDGDPAAGWAIVWGEKPWAGGLSFQIQICHKTKLLEGLWYEFPLMEAEWHHVVMTMQDNGASDELKVYVDGVKYLDTTYDYRSNAFAGLSTSFNLGGYDNHTKYDGFLDDVMYFDEALSQEQVCLLYQELLGQGAYAPVPTSGAMISANQPDLCWTNPEPYVPGTTITSNVYVGTGDPNPSLPGFGYTLIASGTQDTCVPFPAGLTPDQTYHWVVETIDPSFETPNPTSDPNSPCTGGERTPFIWDFYPMNEAPVVDAGPDLYVWLGNASNPSTATVQIDATVTDDGLPSGTLTYLWEETSNPGAVVMDPDDQEDLTAVISAAGTYYFQLTADDTALTDSDVVQVVVAETACQAAQATPGYTPLPGDANDDCIVNLEDFALVALYWLECNSQDCP